MLESSKMIMWSRTSSLSLNNSLPAFGADPRDSIIDNSSKRQNRLVGCFEDACCGVTPPCHVHEAAYRGTSLIRTPPPQDPTVGLCLDSWGGPRRVGVFLRARYPCSVLALSQSIRAPRCGEPGFCVPPTLTELYRGKRIDLTIVGSHCRMPSSVGLSLG